MLARVEGVYHRAAGGGTIVEQIGRVARHDGDLDGVMLGKHGELGLAWVRVMGVGRG